MQTRPLAQFGSAGLRLGACLNAGCYHGAMTNEPPTSAGDPPPQQPSLEGPPQEYPAAVVEPAKGENVLGIAAFTVAVVGFALAVVPWGVINSFIILPVAFVLSLAALAVRDKSKKFAVAGLVVSSVGMIVGVSLLAYWYSV